MSKPEEFKFDSRVRERFLRSRVLTSAELQKHLEQLPDLEGEYEVMSDTPQPAVAPPRSEVSEEPLVFDGIRRLQALSEANAPVSAPRFGMGVSRDGMAAARDGMNAARDGLSATRDGSSAGREATPAVPGSGLGSFREAESRPLGTPLRSALMESEISGVGAGAVSAALGAMAAEARGASVFGVPSSIPHTPAEEPITPVTLRSEASPGGVARVDADDEVDDDVADDDDDDLDDDDEPVGEGDADEAGAADDEELA
jgi:hypothetical protein